MICVAIGRGRHQQMIAQHAHLVEQGAELVELRLDYLPRGVNVKRLLADRPGPAVITCRRECDGGRYGGSEADRQLLLRTAITEGAEYVDLEEDVAGTIPRFGATKRIVSLHDFRQTPHNLKEIHRRLAALDADVVKIATMANQPNDNLRMLQLSAAAKIPTVGICMGEIGVPSRILAGKFGAPFTYATFSTERSLAPGQLAFREMIDLYRYNQIGKETALYGVIGDPIGHSLSPLVHNHAFASEGIDAVYVPFRVPSEHLHELLDCAGEWGFRGLSVTIPHKEGVLEKLATVDEATAAIGACNTIVFDGSHPKGYNTDCQAAMESLDALETKDRPASRSMKGKTAMVLGAGGAAKAIIHGLRKRGLDVTIASRTFDRAKHLAGLFDSKAVEWKHRHAAAHVLVNCTPIGMHPNVDESPYEKHHLKPSTIVFDTVYNPEQTLLVKYARERSCKVVTGVEMFVRQAALQFKLFTGRDAPADKMTQWIKRAIGPAKYN